MDVRLVTPESPEYTRVVSFAQVRYASRINAIVSPLADAFSYAEASRMIVGCIGIYLAQGRKLLLERYVPDAFSRISGQADPDRCECAEIGTRAIIPQSGHGTEDISLALAASLVVYGSLRGIRYIVFTGNRTTPSIASKLGLKVMDIGAANPLLLEAGDKENWREYFGVRQRCFGLRVDSLTGCYEVLKDLQRKDIRFI